MGLIPKIVLTPLKWASKQALHKTLLRFPGGDSHSPIACVYCPEMCRFSCPTAVVSGNDSVTPCNKMGLLYKEEKWPGAVSEDAPLWPIYDCTGCGRCTEYCVYEMPVADQLFEARKKYEWPRAREIALKLNEQEDPVGDLADELGDSKNAALRLKTFTQKNSQQIHVSEPKSLAFLKKNGIQANLSWSALFEPSAIEENREKKLFKKLSEKLSNKKWLLHESVWLSRRLEKANEIESWLKKAQHLGLAIQLPFAHGMDCIDCGGEGAYSQLFPAQAKQMAQEIWERDQSEIDGVLCMSSRCADHFRNSLDSKISILALPELFAELSCE